MRMSDMTEKQTGIKESEAEKKTNSIHRRKSLVN